MRDVRRVQRGRLSGCDCRTWRTLGALWANRKGGKVRRERRYEYRPGLMDRCDPNVIAGSALGIAPGALVTITKRIGAALVWIRDERGNEQSVWKAALVSLRIVRRTRFATYYSAKGER